MAKARLQVVIPMSGTGERFRKAGYVDPKPLISVGGKPIIEHLMERFPKDANFVFICNEDHLNQTKLREVLQRLAPQGKIIAIKPHKLGPVHAVLEASSVIDDTLPTIVNYCDFSFQWDAEHFLDWTKRLDVDGAVICYRGFHPHYFGSTNYAFCRTTPHNRVLEVREKENFTSDRTKEFASSGTYFFRNGKVVKDYFAKAKESGPSYQGEFYVSLVYNQLIQDGLKVQVYQIDTFLQWGTPEDVQDWEYWNKAFEAKRIEGENRPTGPAGVLLMPMAGLGSRFGSDLPPKPLIPVHGQPMFLGASASFPKTVGRLFVARKEITPALKSQLAKGDQLVELAGPTDGQATTCQHALPKLREFPKDVPVWVSSCDHAFSLETEVGSVDVGIVGVKGFPGARRTPKAFAYLDADESLSIKRVSVKVPISDRPQNDWVLIGTFYFRTREIFETLLNDLMERSIVTNGERYLDSVVAIAVEKGYSTKVIPTAGYYCWGTPDALGEYLYWYRYFMGTRSNNT